MVSSGMLRRVALVRTDVSEERSASETSALTRATRRNIPETSFFIVIAVKTSKSYNTPSDATLKLHAFAADNPDDGGDTFLRNVRSNKSHTATHPRRRHSSILHRLKNNTRLESAHELPGCPSRTLAYLMTDATCDICLRPPSISCGYS
jgi:hypothetical protein